MSRSLQFCLSGDFCNNAVIWDAVLAARLGLAYSQFFCSCNSPYNFWLIRSKYSVVASPFASSLFSGSQSQTLPTSSLFALGRKGPTRGSINITVEVRIFLVCNVTRCLDALTCGNSLCSGSPKLMVR